MVEDFTGTKEQSTPSPNMPLRDLFYVAQEYYAMVYVDRVRYYSNQMKDDLEQAVDIAIDECISEGI